MPSAETIFTAAAAAALLSGDKGAMDGIAPGLLELINRKLAMFLRAPCERGHAEDLAQEVFASLLRDPEKTWGGLARGEYDPPQFVKYVETICRNRVSSYFTYEFRTRSRIRERQLDFPSSGDGERGGDPRDQMPAPEKTPEGLSGETLRELCGNAVKLLRNCPSLRGRKVKYFALLLLYGRYWIFRNALKHGAFPAATSRELAEAAIPWSPDERRLFPHPDSPKPLGDLWDAFTSPFLRGGGGDVDLRGLADILGISRANLDQMLKRARMSFRGHVASLSPKPSGMDKSLALFGVISLGGDKRRPDGPGRGHGRDGLLSRARGSTGDGPGGQAGG